MNPPTPDKAMECVIALENTTLPTMSQFLTAGLCNEARREKLAAVVRAHFPPSPVPTTGKTPRTVDPRAYDYLSEQYAKLERAFTTAEQERDEARQIMGPAAFAKEGGIYKICLGYHAETNEYEWLEVVPLSQLTAMRESSGADTERLKYLFKLNAEMNKRPTGNYYLPETIEGLDAARQAGNAAPVAPGREER